MIEHRIAIHLHGIDGVEQRAVVLSQGVIAGWTGRDVEALEKHMVELEALGIRRPASTPIFYRVAASRFVNASAIEVSGGDSSGEAEFVMLQHGGELLIGVGSDHTDRTVEAYGVTVSKQMCEKPISFDFWRFADVEDHWEELVLRSWNEGVLYQEGPVSKMRTPGDLIGRYAPDGLGEGTIMFGGTLAAIGGIRPTPHFAFALEDPVLGRTLRHEYSVVDLPMAG